MSKNTMRNKLNKLLVSLILACGMAMPLAAASQFNTTEQAELEAFRPRNLGLLRSNPDLVSPEFDVSDLMLQTDYVAAPDLERQKELSQSVRTVGAKPGAYSSALEYRSNSSQHRLGNRDAAVTFGWFSSLGFNDYARLLAVKGGVSGELFGSGNYAILEAKVDASYFNKGTPVLKDDEAKFKGDVVLVGQTIEVLNETYTNFQGKKTYPRKNFYQTFFEQAQVVFVGPVPFTLKGRLTGSVGYDNAYAEATFPSFSEGILLYAQVVPNASLDAYGSASPGIEELNRFLSSTGAIAFSAEAGVNLNLLKGGVKFSANANKSQSCLKADIEAITSLSGKVYAKYSYSLPILMTVVDIVDYLCQYDIFNICSSQAVLRFRTIVSGYARNKKEKTIFKWPGTTLNAGQNWGQHCESLPFSEAFSNPIADSSSTPNGNNTDTAGVPTGSGQEYIWTLGSSKADAAGTCYAYKDGLFQGRVDNSSCGRAARLMSIEAPYCTVYVNGLYDKLLDRGEEDCPAPEAVSSNPPDESPSSPDTIICVSAASDPDGDGWGWENNQSCKANSVPAPVVIEGSSAPYLDAAGNIVCRDARSDPDGDGWGWEEGRSCKIDFTAGTYPYGPDLAPPPTVNF